MTPPRIEADRPDASGFQSLYFIRHGETDWNRAGRLQGQRDIPLNARGRDQGAAVGHTLRRLLSRRGLDPGSLDFVASPLGRTRVTMELVRGALGLDPKGYRVDDRLQEIGFGRWEGLTWPEAARLDPVQVAQRKRDKWRTVPPGGESYAQLAERVRPWLTTLERNAIVVAHGGVARAILTLAAGVEPDRAPGIEILQGRVLVLADGRMEWN